VWQPLVKWHDGRTLKLKEGDIEIGLISYDRMTWRISRGRSLFYQETPTTATCYRYDVFVKELTGVSSQLSSRYFVSRLQ
jgi:hypothetical protein